MNFFYTPLISLFSKKRTLTLLVFWLLYFPVFANVYNVTTTTDGNGTNQLRGAIKAADALGGTHTINVPAGTYNLTLGTIVFGNRVQNITITGAGSANTIINMTTTGQDRIFLIDPPGTIAGIQTTITGIRFTNGRLTSDNFGGGAIIAGGPNNALTLTGCIFQNNTIDPSRRSTGGGALRFTGGGALTIDQCTFSNNTSPATTSNSSASGVGGAISFEAYSYSINNVYTYPDNSLSVTNSTFSGNTAASYQNLSGQGGAINVSASGFSTVDPPRPTLSVTIRENTFTGNSVTGAGGRGGAISATNSFSPTSIFFINYNRFFGNTAGSDLGSALISFDTQGSVDATNNWWGCNSGPATCADKAYRFPGSSPGTLTTMPYLQLRTSADNTTLCSGVGTTITSRFTTNAGTAIDASNLSAFTGVPISFTATLGTLSNQQTTIQSSGTATATYTAGSTAGNGTVNAVVDNVPANDATARASVTINGAPTVTNPASAAVCAGTTATFSVTGGGSGTLSYQWFKGAMQLNNGPTATGSTISGAATSTLTIANPGTSDAATNYNVRVSSTTGCGPTTSANASLTVNALPGVTNPANVTTCAGTPVSFSVTGSGSGTLSYQWFRGTTALVNGGSSNISGVTTATLTIGNPGTGDAATTYNVRVSSSTGCTPATSANASLTVNAAPAFTAQPIVNPASGICTGSMVTLTASYAGVGTATASNIQWFKGASTTPLTTGSTGTGSNITALNIGAGSSDITIANVAAADSGNYFLKITSGCGSVTSDAVLVDVKPPFQPVANVSASKSVNVNNYVITNGSCNVIAAVQPSGANPVNGNINASVTITPTVQTVNGIPYAQRHYDIVPSSNVAIATATITLYFTQAEFTAYNNAPNSGFDLPVNPTDAANKANVRILQYHGTGTAPGNYTGTSEEINPADANIIYNGIYGRWEITFTVSGFSGFYLVTAGSQILPLQLTSFSGFTDGSNALLQWKTKDEENMSYFEIERSMDAVQFTKVGQIGVGNSYSFIDKPNVKTVYYYRLKMVDKDGKYMYSYTVAINLRKAATAIQTFPNPFTDKIILRITSPQQSRVEIRLTDVSGKTLIRKIVTLQADINAVTLNDFRAVTKGTYFLQVVNEKMNEFIKVIK